MCRISKQNRRTPTPSKPCSQRQYSYLRRPPGRQSGRVCRRTSLPALVPEVFSGKLSGTVAGKFFLCPRPPDFCPSLCRSFASSSSRFRNSTARAPHIARCDGVRSRRFCFERTYVIGSEVMMPLNRGSTPAISQAFNRRRPSITLPSSVSMSSGRRTAIQGWQRWAREQENLQVNLPEGLHEPYRAGDLLPLLGLRGFLPLRRFWLLQRLDLLPDGDEVAEIKWFTASAPLLAFRKPGTSRTVRSQFRTRCIASLLPRPSVLHVPRRSLSARCRKRFPSRTPGVCSRSPPPLPPQRPLASVRLPCPCSPGSKFPARSHPSARSGRGLSIAGTRRPSTPSGIARAQDMCCAR